MRAVVCTRYGSPDVLELREVAKPVPQDKEVLVRIHATSVTASDCLIRAMDAPLPQRFLIQLAFGFGKPRNPILGMVLSGVIEATGDGVTLFEEGDSVYAYGAVSPTKRRFGAYAEYICLPEDWNIASKPANLTFGEAAAIPYGALLAWHFLKNAKLREGRHVLVYGASGSVGTMAVQLAGGANAAVTAVCSSRNFELVRSLGAEEVIDYTREHAVSQLRKYDLVFDAVGKKKTSPVKIASEEALRPGGKAVSVDDGIPSTSRADFRVIQKMVEEGRLEPVIDRNYRLDEIVEAHRYVERGHKRGNVVITVTEGE